MPLVKKKISVAAGAVSSQVLSGPMNTLTRELELSLLRQLIQRERRLLTQLWTSQSIMPNLQRMQVYRQSLLDNHSDGMEQDTF
jgi:hypothetical protein